MGDSKIWVVAQLRKGSLHPMSREALSAAAQLAELAGGTVEAVLLGHGLDEAAAELSRYEIAAVRRVDDAALEHYTPGAHVGVLAQTIAAQSPDYVVFPHTYQTVDHMPRLAQAIEAALVPEVVEIASGEGGLLFKRPVLGGKLHATVRVKGSGPVLLSAQSGAFAAQEATGGGAPVEDLAVDMTQAAPDREILGTEEVAGEKVDLSQAEAIVAVGRGIGGEDNMPLIEALAAALGAEIGASRPVIDSGWLPRDRQIGSSGQTVAPKLYIAAGISGAIQHLVGMKGAQVVVAINKDRSAPIFNVARYAVIGDLLEVVPAITEALGES